MSTAEARGGPPRYAQLAAVIREDIFSGRLAAGDRVPSEAELMAEHGLSKATVNEALRVLVAEGLVTRRAGSGSFVADHVPPKRIITAPPGTRVWARLSGAGELEGYAAGCTVLIVEMPQRPPVAFPGDRCVILFQVEP